VTKCISRNLLLAVLALCGVALPGAASAQGFEDLFNTAALQRIDLLINSRDWEKLKANFQENEYYPADLRWNGLTVRNIGIRSRGLGSRSGTKPGLRVDFNRYTTGQTLLGLGSVILDNLTQDPSGLKERIAMRFYERMGLPAPREAHATLYVNNEYAGLYAVVESIDKDFLRRVFGGTEGNIENDGHLFEYEYGSEWFFSYPGSTLDAYAVLFDPVTHENASVVELYSPVERMFRAINESPDALFVQAVGEYLDLPLFMRHVAVQSFLAQWDGILGYAGANNFYMYRFENSNRVQFIAWDEDNAFRAIDFPILEGHDRNVLMRRAMAVPELRAIYFAALREAAVSASQVVGASGTSWVEQEIVQQRALVDAMMRADTLKPYANGDYEAAVNGLIAFARERPAFVLAQVTAQGLRVRPAAAIR
jgi:spore coat protein CotH